MMVDAVLKRVEGNSKQTPGEFTHGKFTCKTLELPWLDNKRQISCIPKGEYVVEKRTSARYGEHFWIKNVPGRDTILIHNGNFAYNTKESPDGKDTPDILGCVLVGDGYKDINSDGVLDIVNSKVTLRAMIKALPSKFTLEIC